MKQATLITKITNNCNMGCSYCYYHHNKINDSQNRMDTKILESAICKSIKFNEQCSNFVWHGGEPMLMGIDFFNKIVEIQHDELKKTNKDIVITNCIQTNATLINDEWCSFFKNNKFRVGLSIDGDFDIHSHGRGTTTTEFNNIINSVDLLNKNNIDFSIICVVTNYSIGKEKQIFDFFINNGIRNWSFLPMNYGNLDDCLSPEDYGLFLVNMFHIWINSGISGIKIREFDEYLRGFLGKDQLLCNHCNLCDCYFTITPSGDVYPCDAFPQSSKIKLGNIQDNELEDLKKSNNNLFKDIYKKPDKCCDCKFYNICNGGCRFYRWINSKDFNKEQYYCKSFYMLFESMQKALDSL